MLNYVVRSFVAWDDAERDRHGSENSFDRKLFITEHKKPFNSCCKWWLKHCYNLYLLEVCLQCEVSASKFNITVFVCTDSDRHETRDLLWVPMAALLCLLSFSDGYIKSNTQPTESQSTNEKFAYQSFINKLLTGRQVLDKSASVSLCKIQELIKIHCWLYVVISS